MSLWRCGRPGRQDECHRGFRRDSSGQDYTVTAWQDWARGGSIYVILQIYRNISYLGWSITRICSEPLTQMSSRVPWRCAAASRTFVFDKGLQALDAGRRPASLAHGGRPIYFSPRDENLLDVVACIYALNWMGRAWTLQEGILSGHILFPLHRSLVYLKLLRPHDNDGFGGFWEYLVTSIPKDFRWSARGLLPRSSKPKTEVSKRLHDESEPFREPVRQQLFTHMSSSLYVEEYKNYALTPDSSLLDS